jgi:TatD DNase family protein
VRPFAAERARFGAPMFVDSHCHLSFPELAGDLTGVLARMRAAGVEAALNVCTTLDEFPCVLATAESAPNLYASVGVHPDYTDTPEPTVEGLARRADHPKIVAIGETGLDYYRLHEPLDWQRERFRVHIRAARECSKPLIIHTRAAAADTLRLMREEGADRIGGVMHCFTETADVARQAMDLGFHISFSGIVTFRNARELQATAATVPLERLLIETDAPYLAPVPHRGKQNEPSFVPHVAQKLAELHAVGVDHIATVTSRNFFRLFNIL